MTTRTRTLRVTASHQRGRDTFGLTGLAGKSEGGSGGDEDFYTASISWARPLAPDLSFNSSGSYDHSQFDQDNREDDTYRTTLGLSYSLASNARASLSYNFQARDSSESDQDYYENSVTLGLSISW